MLFIDADISFELKQILAMLEWSQSNPGIVAGRYRAKHKAVDYVGDLENDFSSERFRKAVFAGTGFMLTPRPVLERLIATLSQSQIFFDTCPEHNSGYAFFEPMIDPETREYLS